MKPVAHADASAAGTSIMDGLVPQPLRRGGQIMSSLIHAPSAAVSHVSHTMAAFTPESLSSLVGPSSHPNIHEPQQGSILSGLTNALSHPIESARSGLSRGESLVGEALENWPLTSQERTRREQQERQEAKGKEKTTAPPAS